MKPPVLRVHRLDLIFILFTIFMTIWYWTGVAKVPFHPDETTLIFMSADFETSFKNPGALAWQPSSQDPRQLLRLLDAPLGRYLAGFSRQIAGLAPLGVDWNWSKTWQENQSAGALPSPNLLTASRFGPAALFPFSVILIFLTGKRLKGSLLGWTSAVLLASNALILLHTRRAMAEGGLTFAVCLFIASLVFCRKHPWLIAPAAALAFCAKQSTLPLAGVGLLAVWIFADRPIRWPRLARQLLLYMLIWIGFVGLLNPFLWQHPLESIQAAVTARQNLLSAQTQGFNQALPEAALNSPALVALSLVVNQFILPPSAAEVGNYLAQTDAATQLYLANPLNQLFRGIILGGILLALSTIGLIFGVRLGFTKTEPQHIFWFLLVLSGILQFAALVATITLPFQRYVIPLIPFSCLWIGLVVHQIGERLTQVKAARAVAGPAK